MTEKVYPVRKCVSCGEKKLKTELLRIVRKDSTAEIDPTGKANGRGCYLCKDRNCINNAKKARRIERALEISLPADFYDSISLLAEEK